MKHKRKAILPRYHDTQYRSPHSVAPDAWFYEEPGGLHIYWDGKLMCVIPWRKILAAVRRHVAMTAKRKGRKP